MTDHERQLPLIGRRGPLISVELQEEVARGCVDRAHAVRKCWELSNLEPKEVHDPLDIDQGTFSKILSGKAFLPPNKKFDFMRLCGNLVPLRYDAMQLGFELKPIRNSLERENAELKAELEQERLLNRRLAELIRK